jgi:hypothetical protein
MILRELRPNLQKKKKRTAVHVICMKALRKLRPAPTPNVQSKLRLRQIWPFAAYIKE